MLMAGEEIEEELREGDLDIEPFSEDQLEAASYDLRIGRKVLASHSEREINLEDVGSVIIHPGEFGLINTYEKLDVPADIAGHIGIRSFYTRKGLVLLAGSHLDPGYEGYLTLGVYNAAPREITLDYKDGFCTVEFHALSEPVDQPYESSKHQISDSIPPDDKHYLATLQTESLSSMNESIRQMSESVGNLSEDVSSLNNDVGDLTRNMTQLTANVNNLEKIVWRGLIGLFLAILAAVVLPQIIQVL